MAKLGQLNDGGFSQNEGVRGDGYGKAMLPNMFSGAEFGVPPSTVGQYVDMFEKCISSDNPLVKAGISVPPSQQSFLSMSYMPNMNNSGVIQWQGIPPESLRKIAQENISPQMIIGLRIADVLSFSSLSKHPWKRGWRLELKDKTIEPQKEHGEIIKKAEQFLLNCNTDYIGSTRDEKQFSSFRQFLAMLTRSSLTYDAMAIWTSRDDSTGAINGFKVIDGGNIRLCLPGEGYLGNPDVFCVAVDKTGTVLSEFTRQELIWYVRNPQADPEMYGYGLPEIQLGVRLIQGFQNALDMNVDTFDRNKIPNGMLLLEGVGWTQRQLDILARQWTNMKSGVTKQWSIPAITVPKDGNIKILDLSDIKGKDVYYQDLMNMAVGAFCTVFRIPPTRLGYRISGKGPDSELPVQTAAGREDQEDPGKEELLSHIELIINEYLIDSAFPELRFIFTGKNPKEDAREYEERQHAATVKERRHTAGLPSLEALVKEKNATEKMDEEDYKTEFKMARLMDNAPVDTALSTIYQAILLRAGSDVDPATVGIGRDDIHGNMIDPKKDPAVSEEHGHMSGIRRDSAREKGKKEI